MAEIDGDVAIGHWRIPADGGGERVAWELARAFDAPIFTGGEPAIEPPADVDVRNLFDGRWWVDNVTSAPLGPLRQGALVAGWGSAHRLREFDVLITSGNEPLFYVPGDGQTWIHYAHHTGRHRTDRYHILDEWFGSGALQTLKKWTKYSWVALERWLLEHQTHKPDRFVTNSDIIQDRVMSYWGVPQDGIEVVYPPVETDLSPDRAETQDGLFVTVGRLCDAKRVDDMLEAFAELERTSADPPVLLVAGDGGQREALEELAPPNVELLGYVDEETKRDLLARAEAFVFSAENEDFGIAPVEALAAGTPVIGVDEGFTQYQIQDRCNGILYEHSPGELAEAVRRFRRTDLLWTPEEIAADAQRFATDRFHGRMREVVSEAVQAKRDRRTPDWADRGPLNVDLDVTVQDAQQTAKEGGS